jgi:outer membrane protein TolC
MRRWRTGFLRVGLMVAIALTGCRQQCFLTECDYHEFHQRVGLPVGFENKAEAGVAPVVPLVPDPATVANPEREPRYLTLQEAIAVALENGTIGSQSVRAAGTAGDDLVGFTGLGVAGADSVRVLALQPAIAGAAIEAALARFDTLWSTSMTWNTTDEPAQGLSSFRNGQAATFASSLAKPLPTGGVAGITFSTDYQNLADPPGGFFSVLNPSYTTRFQLGFEQPLLRGAGVDINQLLSGFPGSALFPGIGGRQSNFATEGILLTRLRFDQQRADFERSISHLLLNVEAAYWRLYGAYLNMYSNEQGMRLSLEAWRVAKAEVEAGAKVGSVMSQARAQFEQFRADRMRALGQIIENERTLRTLLGLAVEDGSRLVPVDAPTLAPYQPSWQAALDDAMALRPELVLAREDLKAKQLAVLREKNFLLPDLRFQATHTTVGLGTRLDGAGTFIDATGLPITNNALRSLAGTHFNDWSVGLTLNVPLGYRHEHAQLRQTRLQLAQSYLVLKEQERKAQTFLAKQYSQVIEQYRQIEIRRLQREAASKDLEFRYNLIAGGTKVADDLLLLAQQRWTSALVLEYQAIVDYNIALAGFEFAKGTILQHDNVIIAEGPLPQCAAVRAVEHERQRTEAIVLRERALAVPHPACLTSTGETILPELPTTRAPTVPSLLAGRAGLDEPPPPSFPGIEQPRILPPLGTEPNSISNAATLSFEVPGQAPALGPRTPANGARLGQPIAIMEQSPE